jgi:hypothetical protein
MNTRSPTGPHVEDAHDVGMIEALERPCLALEPAARCRVVGAHDLDRDLALLLRIPGAVHLAHRSRAQLLPQHVTPDPRRVDVLAEHRLRDASKHALRIEVVHCDGR